MRKATGVKGIVTAEHQEKIRRENSRISMKRCLEYFWTNDEVIAALLSNQNKKRKTKKKTSFLL